MPRHFVFNPAQSALRLGTINLSTDIIYAALVTALPDPSFDTLGDVLQVNYSTYTPVILQAKSVNNGVLTCADITFPTFETSPGGIVGFVLCKRLGGSFNNTDPLISFHGFKDPFNQTLLVVPPVSQQLVVAVEPAGLLNLQDSTIFLAGPRINRLDKTGVLYVLGSQNQDRVHSLEDKLRVYTGLPSGRYSALPNQVLVDRDAGDELLPSGKVLLSLTQPNLLVAFFGKKKVSVDAASIMLRYTARKVDASTPPTTVLQVYGSDYLPNYFDGAPYLPDYNLSDHALLLDTFTAPAPLVTGQTATFLHTMNDSTREEYWKFLFVVFSDSSASANIGISELEIYGGRIASDTIDLS